MLYLASTSPDLKCTEHNIGEYDNDGTEISPQKNDEAENSKKDQTTITMSKEIVTIIGAEQVQSVTRYTLLVSVAVVSSFCAFSMATFIGVAGKSGMNIGVLKDESHVPIKLYSLLGIDGVINAFCIYLLFKFGSGLYSRLCRYGNAGFAKCCICFIVCRLKKKLNLNHNVSTETIVH